MTSVGVQLAGGGRIEVNDEPTQIVFTTPGGTYVSIPTDLASMLSLLDGVTQHGNGLYRVTAENLVVDVMWSSDVGDNSVQVTMQLVGQPTTIGPIRLTLDDRVALWEQLDLIRPGH